MIHRKGVTLLELLVCVVIVGSALIIVYQPLLGSLASLRYLENRLEAGQYLASQRWGFEFSAFKNRKIVTDEQGTGVLSDGRSFNYEIKSRPITSDKMLFLTESILTWLQGGVQKSIRRYSYTRLPYEEEKPDIGTDTH